MIQLCLHNVVQSILICPSNYEPSYDWSHISPRQNPYGI